MALSQDDLKKLFPTARADYLAAFESSDRLLDQHGLTREPLALCHFLAQAAHECGEFTILSESGSYSADRLREIFPKYFTAAQAKVYARKSEAILSRAYANRMGNGSEASGEGWKFRGRNMFQTTGKDNYRRLSGLVGVDLLADPDMLNKEMTLGLKAALEEWSRLDLGRIAAQMGPTHEAVLKIARGINLGDVNSGAQPNGLADRKAQFEKIWAVFGKQQIVVRLDPAADGMLEDGEQGDAVEALQKELTRLGYPVGKADGLFGERTQAAVAAFQLRENLDGDPGKWAIAWNDRLATARPFENAARQDATAASMAADGDGVVSALIWMKRGAGGLAGFIGITQAPGGSGLQWPQTFSGIRQVVDPVVGNMQWLLSNKWALGLAGAVGIVFAADWAISRLVERYRAFKVATS